METEIAGYYELAQVLLGQASTTEVEEGYLALAEVILDVQDTLAQLEAVKVSLALDC